MPLLPLPLRLWFFEMAALISACVMRGDFSVTVMATLISFAVVAGSSCTIVMLGFVPLLVVVKRLTVSSTLATMSSILPPACSSSSCNSLIILSIMLPVEWLSQIWCTSSTPEEVLWASPGRCACSSRYLLIWRYAYVVHLILRWASATLPLAFLNWMSWRNRFLVRVALRLLVLGSCGCPMSVLLSRNSVVSLLSSSVLFAVACERLALKRFSVPLSWSVNTILSLFFASMVVGVDTIVGCMSVQTSAQCRFIQSWSYMAMVALAIDADIGTGTAFPAHW